MKKLPTLLLCFSLMTAFKSYGQKPGPEAATKWDQLLQEADAKGKILLLDFSTEWCGPCKAMEKQVFPDKALTATINRYFLLVKLDAEKDEVGRVLGARYGVRGFPTFLMITPQLQLLKVMAGFHSAENFNTILQKVALEKKPENSGYSQEKYLDFPDFYLNLFAEKSNRKKTAPETVTAFLEQQKDLTSEVSWAIINAFPVAPKYVAYFLENYQVYKEKYGANSVEIKAAYALAPPFHQAISDKNPETFVKLLNTLPQYFENPGRQQATYLFNVPKDAAFLAMSVNFLDTAKTITPDIRLSSGMLLLMNDQLPAPYGKKIFQWLTATPDIEKTTDLAIIMRLAMGYYQEGNKAKSKELYERGLKIAGKDTASLHFIHSFKNVLLYN